MGIRKFDHCSLTLLCLVLAGCATHPSVVQPPEPADRGLARDLGDREFVSLESQRTGITKDRGEEAFALTASSARISALPPKAVDDVRVHILPAGSGACHLVECPGEGSTPMLVDCGSTNAVPEVDWKVDELSDYIHDVLEGRQVNVVVSHANTDHYRYLPSILTPDRVKSLWIGGSHEAYNAAFKQWVGRVRASGSRANPKVVEQFPVNWHNDGEAVAGLACGVADTYIVGVNNGDSLNDHSLMLSIDYGYFRAILPGDATKASQDAAMANFPGDQLVATLLVAPHHGAITHGSNSPQWAEAIQPMYVVYSAGASYGHPRCDVVTRYRDVDSLLPARPHEITCATSGTARRHANTNLGEFNTHNSGAVIVTSDQNLDRLELVCIPGPC